MSESDQNRDSESGGQRRRRPRYSGTHPRRFEEKYKELRPEAYPGFHEHVRSRGATPAGTHVPILLNEVMDGLRPATGEVVADCTLGYGGHATEFLRRIGPAGRLIGFDVDAAQIEKTHVRLAEAVPDGKVSLHRANFAGIGNVLGPEGIEGYDIVFADLGVSSMQIDDPSRGFSYKHDGPLDMRMDNRARRGAADLLATMTVEELSAALRELADEPDHAQIARRIVEHRARRPLRRTFELSDLVLEVKGLSRRKWREQAQAARQDSDAEGPRPSVRLLHPAARTFQALRILVNDELGALRQLLRVAPYCLRAGGRIGIITFHSGEDRLVESAFTEGATSGLYAHPLPEPIRPTPAERRDNPRSSPARFRWATRAGLLQ